MVEEDILGVRGSGFGVPCRVVVVLVLVLAETRLSVLGRSRCDTSTGDWSAWGEKPQALDGNLTRLEVRESRDEVASCLRDARFCSGPSAQVGPTLGRWPPRAVGPDKHGVSAHDDWQMEPSSSPALHRDGRE
jgi:hypothetical protein